MATEDFHQAAKNWATIKHTLIAKYLRLFVDKTGMDRDRVFYVDAFAGPGRLKDGSAGSPVYAAEVAAALTGKRKGVLRCINIEPDPETFTSLKQSTAEFEAEGLVINIPGEFQDKRDEVLKKIGGAPALFFVDPFGTEGAELSSLQELKSKTAIREVLVRYDDIRVRRLASWSARHLESLEPAAKKTAIAFQRRTAELTTQAAVGEWLNGNPDARQHLIDGYIGEARNRGIFKYGIAYPIKNPDTAGHRYFLVHLCNFPDGYIWIANFMASAELDFEEMRDQSLFGDQQALISVRDLNRAARKKFVDEIIAAMPEICILRKWGKGVPVQNRYVYAEMVNAFGWHISRTEREGALKQLEKNGQVSLTGVRDRDICTFNLVP
jgi:three-Cys-motif partner protein